MKLGKHPDDKPATAQMRWVFLIILAACVCVMLGAGIPKSFGATHHHRAKTWGVSMMDCWGGISTDWYVTKRAALHEYSLDITSRYSRATRLIRWQHGHAHLVIAWDTPHHCRRAS